MANFIIIPVFEQEPFYLNIDQVINMRISGTDQIQFWWTSQTSATMELAITDNAGGTDIDTTLKAFEAVKEAIDARPGGPFIDVIFPSNVRCSNVIY